MVNKVKIEIANVSEQKARFYQGLKLENLCGNRKLADRSRLLPSDC